MILVLLAILPGVLFAVPITDDFFYDGEGEVLSNSQMEDVEGEGFISFFTNAFMGAVIGGVVSACSLTRPSTDYADSHRAAMSILDGMWQGALSGLTFSIIIPL